MFFFKVRTQNVFMAGNAAVVIEIVHVEKQHTHTHTKYLMTGILYTCQIR